MMVSSRAGLAVAVALCACKPAEEATRAGGPDDAMVYSPERDVGLPSPPSGTVLIGGSGEAATTRSLFAASGSAPPPVGIPDAAAGADASGPQDSAAAPTDNAEIATEDQDAPPADAATPADLGIDLPEAMLAAARAQVGAARERAARRLNRAGLAKHRRLDLRAAIADYLAALERWPGHHFSNYNLACAYALTGAPERALTRLALLASLAALGDEAAEERLRAARVDPDFDALTRDPRFRALTGYAPITVTWAASLDRRRDAERLAGELRGGRIPARAAAAPWGDEVDRPTIYCRAGDAVAEAAADELREALDLGRTDRAERFDLEAARPLVLVLPGDPARRLEPASSIAAHHVAVSDGRADDDLVAGRRDVTATAPARRFADLIGARLITRRGGTVRTLKLKPTGFFTWDIVEPDGRRIARTGRYALKGDSLALDYKERREEPGDDPTRPQISVEEGHSAVFPVEVNAAGLVLDGQTYRAGP